MMNQKTIKKPGVSRRFIHLDHSDLNREHRAF